MRRKRMQAFIGKLEDLRAKFGDQKLSVVIKKLKDKTQSGRPRTSYAQLADLWVGAKVIRAETGCTVSEARRRYALFLEKGGRYPERVNWELAWIIADVFSSEWQQARDEKTMRNRLQAAGVLKPKPPQLQKVSVPPPPPPTQKTPAI